MKYYRQVLLLLLILFLNFFSGCSSADDRFETAILKDSNNESSFDLSLENGEGILKIGVIGPFSPEFNYLLNLALINLSFNEINSKGGINGEKVELIFRDGYCSKIGGTFAAQDLIENYGVNIIIGGLCSSETLGAAQITEKNKVILISPISQSIDISFSGDFVFRTVSSSSKPLEKLADVAYDLGYREIAILTSLTDFTKSQKEVFSERFKELGGEVVWDESYLIGEISIDDRFLKLKNFSGFDSLLLLSQNTEGYNRMKEEMVKLNLSIEQQIFTNYFVVSDSLDFFNGAIFSNFLLSKDESDVSSLIEKIKLNFGLDSYIDSRLWSYATSYDLPYILQSAMKGCDNDITYCIRDNLYVIRDFDGVIDLDRIDSNGDGILNFEIFILTENGVEVFSSEK